MERPSRQSSESTQSRQAGIETDTPRVISFLRSLGRRALLHGGLEHRQAAEANKATLKLVKETYSPDGYRAVKILSKGNAKIIPSAEAQPIDSELIKDLRPGLSTIE